MSDIDTSHEALSELLGVYALDAVDPDEALAVEAHLLDCPKCRAEVEEHRSVASLLGNAGATAPTALWDRISGALDDDESDGNQAAPGVKSGVLTFPVGGRAARPTARRSLGTVVLGTAAALVLLVMGVGAVTTIQRQQDRVDDLAAQVADTSADRRAADALGDPSSTLVRLTAPRDDLEVRAVITEDGVGYLLGEPLPGVDGASTYQLWGVVGTDAVSLGLLGREPDIVEFHVEDPMTSLAITAEQRGGADQPTGDPYVAGQLTRNGDDASLPS